MKPRDLRLVSSVCRHWYNIIGHYKELDRFKLDIHDRLTVVGSFGGEEDSSGKFRESQGLCTDSIGQIFVCDTANQRVQILSRRGKFIRSFNPRDGSCFRPHHIQVSDSMIYISDFWNKRLLILNSNLQMEKIIETDHYIRCFTVTWYILLAYYHQVEIYDLQGNYVRELIPRGSDVSFIGGIASNSLGEIILTDTTQNKIKILNEEGVIIRQFGSTGSLPNQFNAPLGVCLDMDDNIFVADSENSRVSIFTPSGTHLQSIIIPPLKHTKSLPRNLWVTNSSILVSDYINNRIFIIRNKKID